MKRTQVYFSKPFWKIFALRALLYLGLTLLTSFFVTLFTGGLFSFLIVVLAMLWLWIDDVLLISMARQSLLGQTKLRVLFEGALSTLEKQAKNTFVIYLIYTVALEVFLGAAMGLLVTFGIWISWFTGISLIILAIPGAFVLTIMSGLFLFAQLWTLNKICEKLYQVPVVLTKPFVTAMGVAIVGLFVSLVVSVLFWIMSFLSYFGIVFQILMTAGISFLIWIVPFIWLLIEQAFVYNLLDQPGILKEKPVVQEPVIEKPAVEKPDTQKPDVQTPQENLPEAPQQEPEPMPTLPDETILLP